MNATGTARRLAHREPCADGGLSLQCRSLRVDPVVADSGGRRRCGRRPSRRARTPRRAPLRLRADLRHPVLPGLPRIVQRGLADHRSRPHTSGTVIKRGNQIMAAEFSSSSGGFTAGGVFPAVVDEGDVVSPNRNWQQTVTAGAIANAYGVGELISSTSSVATTSRRRGRVTRVKVVGTARTVEGSGDEARWKLGSSRTVHRRGPGATGPIPGLPLPPGSLESLPLPELPPLPDHPGVGGVASCRAAPLPPAAAGSAAPSRSLLQRVTRSPNHRCPMEQAAAPAEDAAIDAKYRELGGAAGTLGEPTGPELCWSTNRASSGPTRGHHRVDAHARHAGRRLAV